MPGGRVSWRPDYSQRLFGKFIKWTPDGLAMVRRCGKIVYLDKSELSWEMQ